MESLDDASEGGCGGEKGRAEHQGCGAKKPGWSVQGAESGAKVGPDIREGVPKCV